MAAFPSCLALFSVKFCGHFFYFCRQAFPQKHGLAVGKSQQVGEHPKPGAQRVLLADVPVNQQPDFSVLAGWQVGK